MARMHPLFRSSVLVAILVVAAAARASAEDLNDYPTSARADYVFGCMKANGETQELLQKCSCSIDVIASIIPYDSYVTAETILSMSQVIGSGRFRISIDRTSQAGAAGVPAGTGGSGNSLLLTGQDQLQLVQERNRPCPREKCSGEIVSR